jgi:hypothetical protein
MKSAAQIGKIPASTPLLADDILEFHAARLLLLLALCGTSGKIEGLTKMAKLDFFVRYPDFFAELCEKIGENERQNSVISVESAMVRHHYGPWDRRYYQILAYLEGRGLITASQNGNSFTLALTPAGSGVSKTLQRNAAFADLCSQMTAVKRVLGRKSGTAIKNLIYKTFTKEVAEMPLGRTIEKK